MAVTDNDIFNLRGHLVRGDSIAFLSSPYEYHGLGANWVIEVGILGITRTMLLEFDTKEQAETFRDQLRHQLGWYAPIKVKEAEDG